MKDIDWVNRYEELLNDKPRYQAIPLLLKEYKLYVIKQNSFKKKPVVTDESLGKEIIRLKKRIEKLLNDNDNLIIELSKSDDSNVSPF